MAASSSRAEQLRKEFKKKTRGPKFNSRDQSTRDRGKSFDKRRRSNYKQFGKPKAVPTKARDRSSGSGKMPKRRKASAKKPSSCEQATEEGRARICVRPSAAQLAVVGGCRPASTRNQWH